MDTMEKNPDITPLTEEEIKHLLCECPLMMPGQTEYLPDITEEDILNELVTDFDGKSGCLCQITLQEVPREQEDKDVIELDNCTTIREMLVMDYRAGISMIDDELIDLTVVFPSVTAEARDFCDIFERYKEKASEYKDGKVNGLMPFLSASFIPYNYPLQGEFVIQQPSLYYLSLENLEGNEMKALHIIVKSDNVYYNIRKVTAAEAEAIIAEEDRRVQEQYGC